MNDTKWRELCASFQDTGFRYRQKSILCDTPADWDGEWYNHPLPYFGIEWLEIATVEVNWMDSKKVLLDRSEEATALLKAVNVPFSREKDCLTVWGYLRPGPKPEFEIS